MMADCVTPGGDSAIETGHDAAASQAGQGTPGQARRPRTDGSNTCHGGPVPGLVCSTKRKLPVAFLERSSDLDNDRDGAL